MGLVSFSCQSLPVWVSTPPISRYFKYLMLASQSQELEIKDGQRVIQVSATYQPPEIVFRILLLIGLNIRKRVSHRQSYENSTQRQPRPLCRCLESRFLHSSTGLDHIRSILLNKIPYEDHQLAPVSTLMISLGLLFLLRRQFINHIRQAIGESQRPRPNYVVWPCGAFATSSTWKMVYLISSVWRTPILLRSIQSSSDSTSWLARIFLIHLEIGRVGWH